MAEQEKRVWVLGAGFSYPLGAPLFHELFSPGTFAILKHLLGNHGIVSQSERSPKLNLPKIATNLYRDYLLSAGANKPSLWSNPEKFLQICNEAMRTKNGKDPMQRQLAQDANQRLQSLYSSDERTRNPTRGIETLLKAAKTQLALEVSMFMFENDFNGECWSPYKTWASSLGYNDTIVTFNYDQAAEKLIDEFGDGASVALPTDEAGMLRRNKTAVYKLHGSSNWLVGENEKFRKVDSPWKLLDECNSNGRDIFDLDFQIAAPGPDKVKMAETGLWSDAMDRIKNAKEVNFIGYRFPETDVLAQQSILDAVMEGGPNKTINIVLGPNTGLPDVQRVAAIFRPVCISVFPHALYGQDFLIQHCNLVRQQKQIARGC